MTPLIHETFTPALLAQTTCVILLDWSTPWRWLRDLRDWITVVMGFLHETTRSKDNAAEYERVVNEIIAQCRSLHSLTQVNPVSADTQKNPLYRQVKLLHQCYR
jgi:hypothetical protein